jgi:hypothetical protein
MSEIPATLCLEVPFDLDFLGVFGSHGLQVLEELWRLKSERIQVWCVVWRFPTSSKPIFCNSWMPVLMPLKLMPAYRRSARYEIVALRVSGSEKQMMVTKSACAALLMAAQSPVRTNASSGEPLTPTRTRGTAGDLPSTCFPLGTWGTWKYSVTHVTASRNVQLRTDIIKSSTDMARSSHTWHFARLRFVRLTEGVRSPC